MSRRNAAVDANQPEIVKALRDVGATVQHIHTVGKGCPDILVGFRGRNHLLEIKDGAKPPSARKLTDDEAVWHRQWLGSVAIVNSTSEALAAIGVGLIEIPHRGQIG